MVKACVQAKTHYMDVSGEPEVCKVSSFKFSLVILVTSRAEVSNSIYLGSSAFKFWVGLSRIMFSVRKALMKHSYVLKYLYFYFKTLTKNYRPSGRQFETPDPRIHSSYMCSRLSLWHLEA